MEHFLLAHHHNISSHTFRFLFFPDVHQPNTYIQQYQNARLFLPLLRNEEGCLLFSIYLKFGND